MVQPMIGASGFINMKVDQHLGNVPLNVFMTLTVIFLWMDIVTVCMENGHILEVALLVGMMTLLFILKKVNHNKTDNISPLFFNHSIIGSSPVPAFVTSLYNSGYGDKNKPNSLHWWWWAGVYSTYDDENENDELCAFRCRLRK